MSIHTSNGCMFIAYKNGEIETYKIVKQVSSVLLPTLQLMDSWNLTDKPH